jgi:hypothetical protein
MEPCLQDPLHFRSAIVNTLLDAATAGFKLGAALKLLDGKRIGAGNIPTSKTRNGPKFEEEAVFVDAQPQSALSVFMLHVNAGPCAVSSTGTLCYPPRMTFLNAIMHPASLTNHNATNWAQAGISNYMHTPSAATVIHTVCYHEFVLTEHS